MATTQKLVDLTRLEQYNNLVKAKFVQPKNITAAQSGNNVDVTFKGVGDSADSKKITLAPSGGLTLATSNDASGNSTITLEAPAGAEYTITKTAPSADSNFSAIYHLTKNGTEIGEAINIPKDFLVKSAEIKEVQTADTPVAGYKVGDKYIDFVINTADSSGTSKEDHLYINVTEIAQVYKAGDGIEIKDTAEDDGALSVVSLKIDKGENKANGLSVGADGLALATATTTTAGAMSVADKTALDKLNGRTYTGDNKGVTLTLDETTNKVTAAIKVNGAKAVVAEASGIGVVVDEANGLSITEGKIALAEATATTPGAMSASDKDKLEKLDTTLNTNYAKSLTAKANTTAGVDLELMNGATTPTALSTVNIKSANEEAITVAIKDNGIVVTPILATDADIENLFK